MSRVQTECRVTSPRQWLGKQPEVLQIVAFPGPLPYALGRLSERLRLKLMMREMRSVHYCLSRFLVVIAWVFECHVIMAICGARKQFTTLSRTVSRCTGAAMLGLCWLSCTQFFHAFSLEYFHGSVTHKTGMFARTFVRGSYLVKAMSEEQCNHIHAFMLPLPGLP